LNHLRLPQALDDCSTAYTACWCGKLIKRRVVQRAPVNQFMKPARRPNQQRGPAAQRDILQQALDIGWRQAVAFSAPLPPLGVALSACRR
jgi:hypothetical protein